MQIILGESDLNGTQWVIEDVIELQTRLTDEEFEATVTEQMEDMQRLKNCAKVLNDREALPARFKDLVEDYKGSAKADPYEQVDL